MPCKSISNSAFTPEQCQQLLALISPCSPCFCYSRKGCIWCSRKGCIFGKCTFFLYLYNVKYRPFQFCTSSTIRPPQRYSPALNYLMLTNGCEPECYDKALQDEKSSKWELAMKDEMNSLLRNQT